jgi:hypothetical protein
MKNLETNYKSEKQNKDLDRPKTMIESKLSSISNFDDLVTSNLKKKPHQQIDDITKLSDRRVQILDKKTRKLADEYFRKFYLRSDDQKDSQKLTNNAVRAKLEINSLANLIDQKKHGSSDEDRLKLLDALFRFKREAEDYRIKDEIARLKILLANEETKIKYSEKTNNHEFVIELKNQIIQLSKEVF